MLELALAGIILLALAFDFINGFHDSANSIATVVTTKALSIRQALLIAAFFNFIGPFLFGTAVAKTIGTGIVDPQAVTPLLVAAALLGSIVWGIITWYYGIPSSSSHALIGGVLGAGIAALGPQNITLDGLTKIIASLIFSPIAGVVLGFAVMLAILHAVKHMRPEKANGFFKKMQVASSSLVSLSHGTNDAQKTMGIITLALVAFGVQSEFSIPLWVIVLSAVTIAAGTAVGGWRIIKTMGTKIFALRPIHGFAAETTSAAIILGSSLAGAPVSTTHVVSSALFGVAGVQRRGAVRWTVARTILVTWILTIPASALVASAAYAALAAILG